MKSCLLHINGTQTMQRRQRQRQADHRHRVKGMDALLCHSLVCLLSSVSAKWMLTESSPIRVADKRKRFHLQAESELVGFYHQRIYDKNDLIK